MSDTRYRYLSEQDAEDELSSEELIAAIQRELRNEWLALRDDGSPTARKAAARCIQFARRVGLLSADEEELWLLRFMSCPGHDDEGGRDWCAYCGRIEQ